MHRRSLLAFLTLGAASPALAQQKKKPAAKQRVIFQVSDADPAKWQLALNNAKNVQADLGKDNVQIEIIAYVQAGVTHIMKRQREGWAYIRP